jgi:uncharacterized protein
MPFDALLSNLLSPLVLAFVLGLAAALLRSDLRIPEALYTALTLYLLLAIGLKGGVALSKTPMAAFAGPALGTLALSLVTPLTAFGVLHRMLRFDRINAAALAAHYGSVSAVTFLAAVSFATLLGVSSEGFMPALVALLEVPAIVVGLLLASGTRSDSWKTALHEVLVGRSIVLLVGGLLIGLVVGEAGFEPVKPFFVAGFPGALTLFLLEMGLITAPRLHDLRHVGARLIGFALAVPILHGVLGVTVGHWCGLGVGGSGVLGAMAASASYIAAPAAVRIALPEASPTLYLTAALGITFPFNLTLGLPLYFGFARWLAA